MDASAWNKGLETGHPQIDQQHRTLFDTFSRLKTALERGIRGFKEPFRPHAEFDRGSGCGFLRFLCSSRLQSTLVASQPYRWASAWEGYAAVP